MGTPINIPCVAIHASTNMNNTSNPIGIISWQLNVECPKCEEEFDVVGQDANRDYVIATKIFNNDWDSVAGCDVTCPNCEHEFQIGGIEY